MHLRGSDQPISYSEQGKALYKGKGLAILESLDRNMNSIQWEIKGLYAKKGTNLS
jgi:hypothetical protein